MVAEKKRRREKERLLALSFCRADLLFELNINRNIEFSAGATLPLIGKTTEELDGSNFLDIVHGEDQQLTTELLDSADHKGRMDDVSLSLKNARGNKLPIILSGYRVPDFDNHFFIALKVDTQQQSLGKALELKHDKETNLLETESYANAAAQRVTSFLHAGGEAQVSMVKVNHLDTLLTKVGASDKKKLLTAIGNILNENSIGGDTASRIDGDSFSFAHSTAVDPESINQQIESLAASAHEDGNMVQSISQTLDVDGAGMTEAQVARALIFTMQNFCENLGTVRETSLSDSLSAMMTNTVENVSYIKEVIKKRDLEIHFMPINHLKHNFVHHFEGLVRFKGRGLDESPYHMIRLAEEVGIICDLDMAIIKKSIDSIRHFRQKHFIPPVAINLSGLSLCNEVFMGELTNILRNSPEISGQLMFEITESAKIRDLPLVNHLLQAIRELGFEVCLDDFGSGSASFDYLNALDVDVVKFDGPVVKRAYSTDKGCDLIRAMSNMCHDLNIHTVAEMIEDEKMANLMRDCGIDFGQGYYFGKADDNPLQYKHRFEHAHKARMR